MIDCTDIKFAALVLMSQQSATHSSYRGMNSFKVIIGVAPKCWNNPCKQVIHVSFANKAIIQESGLLNHLTHGVSVKIPPFLNKGAFTESEAKATKGMARCHIHVERAHAWLKDFRILTFIPSYLCCYSDILLKLSAALVRLQFPLVMERCEDKVFE